MMNNSLDCLQYRLDNLGKGFRSFLEEAPPNVSIHVDDAVLSGSYAAYKRLLTPKISLYCSHIDCGRVSNYRIHKNVDEVSINGENVFLEYQCSNCGIEKKTYAVHVQPHAEIKEAAICVKYGEIPAYKSELIAPNYEILDLAEDDKSHFLKGRMCEINSYGIGANAYYRRIVENQKNDLIDLIIKIAEVEEYTVEEINVFKKAKSKTQFTDAIKDIERYLPRGLFIGGKNPLTRLHWALSSSIHNLSDEDNLSRAVEVRDLLETMVAKVGQVLKEHEQLQEKMARYER